jgi:bifunctional non-homologous end joining protein LigD
VRVVCCVGPAAETVRSPAAKRRDARKRALLFDPLPERVEPCLALLAEGARWRRLGYEVKSDGYRLTGIRPGSRDHARRSRLDHPLSDNCPRCARAASRQCHPYGEAVVLDERGAPDSGALQKALGSRGGKRSAAGALLYAYDRSVLFQRPRLQALPLAERRMTLMDLIGKQHSTIRLSEEIDADGKAEAEKVYRIN